MGPDDEDYDGYQDYSDYGDNLEYEADYSDEDLIDGVGFADPGGNSALRAATKDNPRNLPCPTCGSLNRLTPIDVAKGYHCNTCSDALERGY